MASSKVTMKIDAAIYEKISAEAKRKHVSKTEMLESITEKYFRDLEIEHGNDDLKSIVRKQNENIETIVADLEKLVADSAINKNIIEMFYQEITGSYDPDDLEGNF